MYVPPIYQVADRALLRAVVRNYPLAILVTNGGRLPYATHLPIVIRRGSANDGLSLLGQTLLGHMNRANPHWSSLEHGVPGKLVFSGPHSYITPALYEPGPAAPTWDFITVHLEGVIQLIDDLEETLDVVRETVAIFERDFGSGWQDSESLDYFRQIGRGVGAFTFTVEAADGMFKLSQEKAPDVRDSISRHLLAQNGCPRDLGVVLRDFTARDATR